MPRMVWTGAMHDAMAPVERREWLASLHWREIRIYRNVARTVRRYSCCTVVLPNLGAVRGNRACSKNNPFLPPSNREWRVSITVVAMECGRCHLCNGNGEERHMKRTAARKLRRLRHYDTLWLVSTEGELAPLHGTMQPGCDTKPTIVLDHRMDNHELSNHTTKSVVSVA
jgi:hypothetical protein